jgi:hypothetical protein
VSENRSAHENIWTEKESMCSSGYYIIRKSEGSDCHLIFVKEGMIG